MTTSVPTVTLNNDVQMPILGFGVYQIAPDDTERAVSDALAVGYRHLVPDQPDLLVRLVSRPSHRRGCRPRWGRGG